MKILILGAGQVGGTLAESLAQEAFDITLVDIDGERLHDLGIRLDIQTIEGSASHPNVLRKAGADDADMLEDMICLATNNAHEQAAAAKAQKMKEITGGLPLPPGMSLPF